MLQQKVKTFSIWAGQVPNVLTRKATDLSLSVALETAKNLEDPEIILLASTGARIIKRRGGRDL